MVMSSQRADVILAQIGGAENLLLATDLLFDTS